MEAYLKKLCFEYQVDEKEVKELLARMEMVYLDKGETIASATMPEQSLYIIVSGILHTYTTHEGEDRTIRFLSEGDAVLCYNSSQYAVKALTKCAAYYISEEEIEELCATSISFANLVRQLMEYQFYFKEEENMNVRKLTVREVSFFIGRNPRYSVQGTFEVYYSLSGCRCNQFGIYGWKF